MSLVLPSYGHHVSGRCSFCFAARPAGTTFLPFFGFQHLFLPFCSVLKTVFTHTLFALVPGSLVIHSHTCPASGHGRARWSLDRAKRPLNPYTILVICLEFQQMKCFWSSLSYFLNDSHKIIRSTNLAITGFFKFSKKM